MFPAALLQAVQLLRAIAPGLLAVYAFTLILLAAHMLAGKRFP
ncbi:TPA_asm: MC004.1L [Molluscum contagiosum virus]|uniref:MC004.1L n=1 Tax=Molluscum contagiosum virus TaxID=10279 RepID=A0A858A1K4_9POXV|nr:MC004.1 [Molluscum contagiosum virus subtype 1]QHW16732.1 MC004.1L [Molluscum contagiosum virus]AQY16923.1 MC004.1 [Molluscum contagiosum virus subtype 1]AQY17102.1 MC004.1 [Molluscum contagiosum virus subtype 1]AYO87455.1 MC004.1 [Molluscum contagiosum virus subtype 1]